MREGEKVKVDKENKEGKRGNKENHNSKNLKVIIQSGTSEGIFLKNQMH